MRNRRASPGVGRRPHPSAPVADGPIPLAGDRYSRRTDGGEKGWSTVSTPLLLVLVAAAIAIGFLAAAGRPAAPARVARFARRHGLDLTPERSAAVAEYLTETRRARTIGAVLGWVLSLAWTLPEQRISLEAVPLLAGWLIGAWVAEHRHGGPAVWQATTSTTASALPAVPAWLRRIPPVIGLTAAAVTALALWVRPDPIVAAWGAGAAATAALVAATVRYVARRAPREGDAAAVDRAVRAHASAAVTAVGVVLATHCLLFQFVEVQHGLYGETLAAAKGISTLWAVGSLFLAFAVWAAAAPGGPRRGPAFIAACLVLATVGWAAFGVWRDRPPFGPDDLRPTATVRLTTQAGFEADAAALGVTGLTSLVTGPHQQAVVGRVDVAPPAGRVHDGTYYIMVVDTRSNTSVPALYGPDGSSWSSEFAQLAERYSWLSALAAPQDLYGMTSDPAAVAVPSAQGGPIGFSALIPAGAKPSDLLVALVYAGPQGQLYWAVRVPVTATSA